MHPTQPPPDPPAPKNWVQFPAAPQPPNRDQFQHPMAPPQQPTHQQVFPAGAYVIPPKGINHGAHLLADLFTLGLWVPFHLVIWAFTSRKSTVVYPDGRRVKR